MRAMKPPLRLRALAAAAALSATFATTFAAAPAAANTLRTVEVAQGLDNPWALAFLPDGRMLVTEKPGRLRVIGPDGRPGAPITGLPPIAAGGQCGLLDVVPDPQFTQNQLLYWTFAEPGAGGNSTALARGKLVGNALTEVRTLFSQQPKVDSQHHCGSRIVFRRDGTLLVGLGDRFSRKDDAQNPNNHLGKVVALDRDGAKATVWSLGHRNIQGAALHPETGALWAIEHGPQGGDEVNVVEQGRNYGWPLLTYGRNYGLGTRIGEEGPKPGFEQPLHVWVPSIAPSGMAFLTSDRYPGWQNQLFVGALRGRALVRLQLDGTKVVNEERLLLNLAERIRDVRQGPDGWLYLVTDGNNARVLRVELAR
jgi:glucose/arabinose dehydrogenase